LWEWKNWFVCKLKNRHGKPFDRQKRISDSPALSFGKKARTFFTIAVKSLLQKQQLVTN